MLVPAALIVVAVAGVLLFAFQHESNPPPLAFQFLFSLFIASVAGSILALLVLGVGYVNRDARRRGMNSTL
jgi:hypothetical protein